MPGKVVPDDAISGGGAEPRWHPEPGVRWRFDIDVVGGCNLRCPSCPIGNSPGVKNPTGTMAPELLDRIVAKALSECGKVDFFLYNWTEPFLHPRLPELIRVVHAHGARCALSTNLNLIKNLDEILAANPEAIKISLSGFTQDSYGITHRRGDIEVVKRNMAELARARRRARSTTRVVVPFHRYLGNHGEEDLMRQYAGTLGFDFDPAWAYLMPLEKVLAFLDPALTDVTLTEDDHALIGKLALPLGRAIEVARNAPARPCVLRERQMAINFQGRTMLCCTVYDQDRYGIGAFLEQPLAELQASKYRHSQCATCMANGLHVLFTYGTDQFDRVALENVARHHPGARLQGVEEIQRRRPRGVRALPRKIRREYERIRRRLRRN